VVVLLVDGLEESRDIARSDDTASLPDLDNGGEIDAPFVLVVRYSEEFEALDEGGQEGTVRRLSELLDELLLVVDFDLLDFGYGAMHGFCGVCSLGSVCRFDAEDVACCYRGDGDVLCDALLDCPDTCSFCLVYILDDLVFDLVQFWLVVFWIGGSTDLDAYTDEEVVLLSSSLASAILSSNVDSQNT